jgi:enediyne biosynthesis protein E4
VRLQPAPSHSAEGAEVVVYADGRRWFRGSTTGGSYLSAGDPRVHVGLGPTAAVGRVEVRWPDGRRQSVAHPPVDRELPLKEVAE